MLTIYEQLIGIRKHMEVEATRRTGDTTPIPKNSRFASNAMKLRGEKARAAILAAFAIDTYPTLRSIITDELSELTVYRWTRWHIKEGNVAVHETNGRGLNVKSKLRLLTQEEKNASRSALRARR